MDISDNIKHERSMMGLGYVDQQVMPKSNEVLLVSERVSSQQSEIEAQDIDAWTVALVRSLASQVDNQASSDNDSSLHKLALSIVRQSLVDAGEGDYDALEWLITEGREWLTELGVSSWIVDVWECELP
jgi:hypothetical protein